MHALAESAVMLALYGNEGTIFAFGIIGLIYVAYRSFCNALDERRPGDGDRG
ncbi:hypothetical protein [Cloacibacillus evryensis]|uniref:Uncharacterized protein n=1 Tax=Cloacibacillus evryensis TaxID=508460 RepID=A0AAW5K2V7_9BACT|nr:hypothetical protein [Cloacibacillus evryensis]EHL68435.1 hypothetical protein HMPREF1006_02458 [Synergistes sp. 3_1_syn1]MCQ4814221.1 hypothetical protein [Cloacibacillus evryensis]